MSDIKLFRIDSDTVTQLRSSSVRLEKNLQSIMEKNLEVFLGTCFLATEYSTTGKTHDGRIDTLGIDENNCPVIIEYKRKVSENVLTQGLFYLDWLMDHQAEFKLLVMDKLGVEMANNIEWKSPRLLCIANKFNKFDNHAVQQMQRNIELIKYRQFEEDLLMLELVYPKNTQKGSPAAKSSSKSSTPRKNKPTREEKISEATEPIIPPVPPQKSVAPAPKTISGILSCMEPPLSERYETLRAFLFSLGDDVQEKTLKPYVAFKRIKNFVCIQVHLQIETIVLYVKVDPDSVTLEEGFTRDARKFGHNGSGDLEIRLTSGEDLEKAKHFIIESYENN